jgi:hypothetical protein
MCRDDWGLDPGRKKKGRREEGSNPGGESRLSTFPFPPTTSSLNQDPPATLAIYHGVSIPSSTRRSPIRSMLTLTPYEETTEDPSR